MKSEDLQYLSALVRRESGLALQPAKAHFIESRLALVAKRHGFRDVGALVNGLREGEPFRADVVEAVTTHESYFFRDRVSFDAFRDVMLPALTRAKKKTSRRLRIWCAGASTGQEPYSLAMVVEALGDTLDGWAVHILASDMDAQVIERAKAGIYSEFEIMRGLPIQMLARHFTRAGDEWRLSAALRERVQFKVFNLMQPFDGLGLFDVIFCRNVLLHFDAAAKKSVLARLGAQLGAGGYLVLGSDESLGRLKPFKALGSTRGVYVKTR